MEIRTDLALEANDTIDVQEHEGITIFEKKAGSINIIRMDVVSEKGSQAIHKPIGTYITMEVPELVTDDENYHKNVSEALASEIKEIILSMDTGGGRIPEILVAGLGNMEAAPDSLGPKTVSNLMITRHLNKDENNMFASVSAISPGVMAQTGMETSEIIMGIVKETAPDLLVVVDSLAARKLSRLTTTIQISSAGIEPGSGVGNNRKAINSSIMGIPVIAIGVPTVVDAATLIYDCKKSREADEEEYKSMYVTSKDIDSLIKRISYTISEAINMCMSNQL